MTHEEILHYCDCTALKQNMTWAEVKAILDFAILVQPAQIAVTPAHLKAAKEYVCDLVKIGTGVGYPNGYNTTLTKCFETEDALRNGADEIDMVINIGWAKEHLYGSITNEIRQIKNICGSKICKVIIETFFLSDSEKIDLCGCVSEGGADYIKTSTGFTAGGATMHDVLLIRDHISPSVKIKASGGISTFEDAELFIMNGCSRIGTSKLFGLYQKNK